jgi:hypothetical protein
MEFSAQLKVFSKRIESLLPNISTEEGTKNALVMPMFQMLGYDVFNPEEFIPEFTADVGIKKGERIDYAIKIDGSPVLLIEVKPATEKLERHDSQLFRYFAVSKAKFAILTNGVNYKFYTDLDEHNKMDLRPFLDVNLLELKDSQINEFFKFHKSKFDVNYIFSSAEELKYTTEIKQILANQMDNPSKGFIEFMIGEVYPGRKTQNTIEKFTPIIKKSYSQFINELMNERIKSALETDSRKEDVIENKVSQEIEQNTNKIETTNEEIEAYYIIKNILKDNVEFSRIKYKDTESYFNILLDSNVRKWVCRIHSNTKGRFVQFNSLVYKERYEIKNVLDIYNYSDMLKESADFIK